MGVKRQKRNGKKAKEFARPPDALQTRTRNEDRNMKKEIKQESVDQTE